MPIVPLYGHAALQSRFRQSVARNSLPSSILLHGPRGSGKQRLALWLGQLLLCTGEGSAPCGVCVNCRYAQELAHPDLRWFFPRPRLADADASTDDVLMDYVDAVGERVASGALYAPPSGAEGIFVASVRAIVRLAALTPTVGRRKIFVVGDAERMVPQEGSEFAANAFLKLLEEPLPDTTLLLTSSEPDALLPTIRSRVVSVRVPRLADEDMRSFLADARVSSALDKAGVPKPIDARIRIAEGTPGALFSDAARADAADVARAFLSAVGAGRSERLRAALAFGGSKARGFFSDVLDALTLQLRERARGAAVRHDSRATLAAGKAVEVVERAKLRASGNVSPQLLAASMARELAELDA